MADLGAIGELAAERWAFAFPRALPAYEGGAWVRTWERFMTTPWVPVVPEQYWWTVPDPLVMPRLLAPYRFDNLVEVAEPGLSLVYGDNWFGRSRGGLGPAFTLIPEQGLRRPCFAADLVTLTGRVAHGEPLKLSVLLHGWSERQIYARQVPDAEGVWTAEVPPGAYGISYQADGFQPLTHGPYVIA